MPEEGLFFYYSASPDWLAEKTTHTRRAAAEQRADRCFQQERLYEVIQLVDDSPLRIKDV